MTEADAAAFAAKPETTGNVAVNAPQTGAEYLASLADDRAVFIYGERVKDVTKHPAFRNTARMVARLYDALHDPKRKDKMLLPTDTGNGGMTHAFFKAPKTPAEYDRGPRRDRGMGQRSPTAGWAVRRTTRRRSSPRSAPMPISTILTRTNAKRWYKFSQERVPFINHAIIHPPIDRDKPPNEVGDVCCHVEKETDAGLIVSGAKVVATGSVADELHVRRASRPHPGAGQESLPRSSSCRPTRPA